MTTKPTPPKITVTRPPGKLNADWVDWDFDADFGLTVGVPRVRCQCPQCLKLWWSEFHPGGLNDGGRPRAACPDCQAARDFATLPWWRRTWARITGRRA